MMPPECLDFCVPLLPKRPTSSAAARSTAVRLPRRRACATISTPASRAFFKVQQPCEPEICELCFARPRGPAARVREPGCGKDSPLLDVTDCPELLPDRLLRAVNTVMSFARSSNIDLIFERTSRSSVGRSPREPTPCRPIRRPQSTVLSVLNTYGSICCHLRNQQRVGVGREVGAPFGPADKEGTGYGSHYG
jgi:hypothetical protein